ncbi:DUF3488 and transglutaminase-like domain-containing protein [Cryptosporangium phraense]|uniref:Transglutaminase domain-containing protein n=1 Tax=Cryptosporangium phraense TaxID=2593070 RepID=A0A545AKY2_9ACTN|nr:DUF3488 and transglutaminase-like domain-containing protein [Cryptosporangium phraense]TQS41973.1 transglutaminase domain-containing protein [Cryptosporangium phraense]
MSVPIRPLTICGLLAGIAGLSFHRGFELGSLIAPVLLAAVLPVVAVGVQCVRGRPGLVVGVVVSAALWLVVVTVTLFRPSEGVPTLAAMRDLGDALLHGWSRFLDVSLPAPARPDLLLVPEVLTWCAASSAAGLVVRTRSRFGPALPAVGVFVVATVLTVPGPGPVLISAAALAIGVCLLALSRSESVLPAPGLRRRTARALSVGAPLVVASTTIVLAAGWLPLPASTPYDPRDAVRTQVVGLTESDPLSRAQSWLSQPGRPLFTVASERPRNLSLAALNRFDGERWSSSAEFVSPGLRLPGADRTAGPTERVRETITVQGLDGSLLPATSTPIELDGVRPRVDPDSGTLLSSGPLGRGLTYAVVSDVPKPVSARTLASLREATDSSARSAVALPPGTPSALTLLAQYATRSSNGAFQRAADLEAYLRANYRNNPSASPGVSYGHLTEFLGGSHGGTSAQFAATFAVMARSLRLPTRIVVGFVPGTTVPGTSLRQVRTDDVLVWNQVKFAGLGWFSFFPTPNKSARESPDAAVLPAPGETAARAAAVAAARRLPPAHAQARARTGAFDAPVHREALVVLAFLVPLALYVAVIVLVPVLRRHRRRSTGSARHRLVGAWWDGLTELDRTGALVPSSATASEVAVLGGRTSAAIGPVFAQLARDADRALFSNDPVSADQAASAWARADEIRAVLRRGQKPGARLGSRLSVRALRIPAGCRHD